MNSVMKFRFPENARTLASGCTTCGLLSGTQLHRVSYIVKLVYHIYDVLYT
jgi:hypothetical protein